MDHKQHLSTMLHDLINGKDEQAEQAIHSYLVGKMREVSGLGGSTPAVEAEDLEITPSNAE